MLSNWQPIASFDQQLRDFIQLFEGKTPTPYDDGRGFLTIGIGFNLTDGAVRNAVFQRIGINPTAFNAGTPERIAEDSYVQQLTAAIMTRNSALLDQLISARATKESSKYKWNT